MRWVQAAIVVSLTACSASSFVYNRADWFVAREVDRYVALRDDQRTALRAAVVDWQDWHRSEALPLWHADTVAFARAVEAPLTVDGVGGWAERADDHVFRALDEMLVRVVPLLATLDDAQIDAFWEAFDTARDERRKERPRDAAALKKRAVKQARRWIGRPTPEQRALMHAWADAQAARSVATAEATETREAERRAWLADLLDARQSPDAVAHWRQFLDDVSDPAGGPDGPAANPDDTDAERVMQLLSELSDTLSVGQRQRLTRRLQRYADLFDAWATGG